MQVSAVTIPPDIGVGESGKPDYQTSGIYKINSIRIDPRKVPGTDIFLCNDGKRNNRDYRSGRGELLLSDLINNDYVNNLFFMCRIKSSKVTPVILRKFKNLAGSL